MVRPDEGTEAMGPLHGIRVISMAEQYPGPYCTMLLADMGADVILVERPGRGDPARGPTGMSDHFAALSRNKRSIAVDAKQEAGREVVCRLARAADVLVEGFRPGVMERLGLGYAALQEVNPGLIYCSITGYGQDGPYRSRPGHDLSYQALAGLLASLIPTGRFDGRPGVAIGDLSSAMFAALGIVAALVARAQTGRGQYIDVSMTDGLVSWMGTALTAALNHPEAHRGAGAGEPAYGVFRCADGRFLTLSIAHEDHFWRNLCAVLDRPDLAALPSGERRQRRAELREWLQSALLARARDEWVEILVAADVPAGPVLSLPEVVNDAQLTGRGLFGRFDDRSGMGHVGHPIRFSETPAAVRTPPPALGADTDQVLTAIGYSAGEIAALRKQAIVDGPPNPRPRP
jgi:crotonobetainyl-CoA:carnitine CoA-transferase CaiB-like acyl-CoA transferase